MRQVISLSFAENIAKEVKILSKKSGYFSVSKYIQDLVEMDKEIISEQELLSSIKQSRQEYKKGKAITAKSMAELI
jgi:metal-responsive CopG/Arc/MetJ family transcriptional regulator